MKKFVLLTSLLLLPLSGFAEQRIISAGASVTELIYALGAEKKLVAVDSTSRNFTKGSQIPQVGYHRSLSTEGLLSLNPTLLLGSNEMGPETTLAKLESANVNVVVVPPGDEIANLYSRIDTVAKLTDTREKAEQIKQQVADSVEQLQNASLKEKPSVLFLLINEARPLSVGGDKTPVNKIISLSGASNPAADEVESYKPISLEAIIAMEPDYILVSEYAWKKHGGAEGVLKLYPLLKLTPAGEKKQILAIPGGALSGGFGLQSIKLAKTLHDKFSG